MKQLITVSFVADSDDGARFRPSDVVAELEAQLDVLGHEIRFGVPDPVDVTIVDMTMVSAIEIDIVDVNAT